jgi:hypothetical protein
MRNLNIEIQWCASKLTSAASKRLTRVRETPVSNFSEITAYCDIQ